MENIEINKRNNALINQFTKDYYNRGAPIEISFRDLIPEIKNIDRYTHLIHAYPAKLLVHIPYFFLNNNVFSQEGDLILDPFSGSGTVLLESIVAKRNAIGADANPLARLISTTKISKLNLVEIEDTLNKIILNAQESEEKPVIPDVVNCNYWFSEEVKLNLGRIFTQIQRLENDKIQSFFLVSLSNCVKKVSFADPRISVPVKLNPNRYKPNSILYDKTIMRLKSIESVNVFEKFKMICQDNINRFLNFEKIRSDDYNADVISDDARELYVNMEKRERFPDSSVQLIITSPPYAGAQKYIRASSLNLGWTGLSDVKGLSILNDKNIGRETFRKDNIKISDIGIEEADFLIQKIYKINPTRATIICSYLKEMIQAINEMFRVLKKDGYLVLVIGNNKVCNYEFNTQEYLTSYLISLGLVLQFKLIDNIRSYGLMTKRNKTADIISREWVLVFKK